MATPKKAASKREFKTPAAAARYISLGLKKLPDVYVQCRDMKHAWSIEHDFHVEPGTTVGGKVVLLRRLLKCGRCETLRVEHYTSGRYGLDKTAQSYVHPNDYKLPGIPPGVRVSSIVQQESYRRAMERATGAAKGQRATAED